MKKIRLAIAATSLVSFFLCVVFSSQINDALFLIVLYPLFYGVFAVFLCTQLTDKAKGGRLTVSVFLLLQWLRNVLLPAAGVVTGYFSTVTDEASALRASILCLIELIVTTAFCAAVLKYSRKRQPQERIVYELAGNRYIYIIFALAMLVLFLYRGKGMYTFLSLSLNTTSRASLSDRNLVLQALIEYGMTSFMIVFLFFCYSQYNKTGKKLFFWLALVVSMLRICVISTESESRMAILYSVGVLMFMLPRLFPNDRKKVFTFILAVGVLVIGLLTVYKTFRAFRYGSYIEAITNDEAASDSLTLANTLDSYFYGVKDVARNIYISRFADLSYKNVIADIVQNIFGLKYLIPSTGNTTIGAYNFYIYSGKRISGHLYSSIAYGYSYFGMILAPMATCVNIMVSAYLEGFLNRFRKLDALYINCLVFVRGAATMFACFPLCLNYLARTLILGSIMVGGASLFIRRNSILDSMKKPSPQKTLHGI